MRRRKKRKRKRMGREKIEKRNEVEKEEVVEERITVHVRRRKRTGKGAIKKRTRKKREEKRRELLYKTTSRGRREGEPEEEKEAKENTTKIIRREGRGEGDHNITSPPHNTQPHSHLSISSDSRRIRDGTSCLADPFITSAGLFTASPARLTLLPSTC